MSRLNDTLYLGFKGCFAKFDIKAKTFNIIASTKAVQIKNDLDGGLPYSISNILADDKQNLVWLGVSGFRGGIWRYTPAIGELNHIPHAWGNPWIVLNDDGEILFEDSGQPNLLNPETGQIKSLKGYSKEFHMGSRDTVMLGKDIIYISYRTLLSDDGKVSKLDKYWKKLERFGSGIITVGSGNNPTGLDLSFIQPKESVKSNSVSNEKQT